MTFTVVELLFPIDIPITLTADPFCVGVNRAGRFVEDVMAPADPVAAVVGNELNVIVTALPMRTILYPIVTVPVNGPVKPNVELNSS